MFGLCWILHVIKTWSSGCIYSVKSCWRSMKMIHSTFDENHLWTVLRCIDRLTHCNEGENEEKSKVNRNFMNASRFDCILLDINFSTFMFSAVVLHFIWSIIFCQTQLSFNVYEYQWKRPKLKMILSKVEAILHACWMLRSRCEGSMWRGSSQNH